MVSCVARNNHSEILCWKAKCIPTCTLLLAFKLAIDLAISFNWNAVLIEGDTKCIIQALDLQDSLANWSSSSILDDCLVKLHSILCWTAPFTPRVANMLAHNIAK